MTVAHSKRILFYSSWTLWIQFSPNETENLMNSANWRILSVSHVFVSCTRGCRFEFILQKCCDCIQWKHLRKIQMSLINSFIFKRQRFQLETILCISETVFEAYLTTAIQNFSITSRMSLRFSFVNYWNSNRKIWIEKGYFYWSCLLKYVFNF